MDHDGPPIIPIFSDPPNIPMSDPPVSLRIQPHNKICAACEDSDH